jgi:putative nucleotidyltransferase with HDIG domain
MKHLEPSPPPRTPSEAIRWLAAIGAHPWLVRHHELVLEAAESLLDGLHRRLRLRVDRGRVLLGAALHDVGKKLHPAEMQMAGHAHEEAGERLLREAGLDERIARIAVTHASWSDPRAELEDRLVALADKLWKGKRDQDLETALLDEIAARIGRDRWSVFDAFDALCDEIASDGPDRLQRSDV